MNRRIFLKASGASMVGCALMRPSSATAQIAEGIAIVAAVAGIIAAFTKSGDGGLSAYLESIRGLQAETLQQLAAVQLKLGEMHSAIRRLPAEFTGVVRGNDLEIVDAKINGCAEELRICSSARERFDTMTPQQQVAAKAAERALRDRIVEARQTLQGRSALRGLPHAALIMAYAFPVELAARFFVGEDPGTLGSVIDGYRTWLTYIQDETSAGSTYGHIAEWKRLHDEAYGDAIKADGMTKELILASPITYDCFEYIEYRPPLPAVYRSRKVGSAREGNLDTEDVKVTDEIPAHVGRLSRVFVERRAREIDKSGARFIELIKNERVDSDDDFSISGCKHTNAPSAAPEVRVAKLKSDAAFGYTTFQSDLAKAAATISAINQARLQMAFGASALVIAAEMQHQLDRAEALYAT